MIIIDYGMGNVGSIQNMLKRIGARSIISGSLDEIEKAEKLILPGVGSFDNGMKNLKNRNLIAILNKKVLEDRIPILGICLGMQLMTASSEEGAMQGLGWLHAKTVRFAFNSKNGQLRIPHMGWDFIKTKKEHPLLGGLGDDARFYFVHSYHVECDQEEDILATTEYGHEFVSAFCSNNILGVQFHPEKSHTFGMHVLRNFVEL